jgi:hypothetical protein
MAINYIVIAAASKSDAVKKTKKSAAILREAQARLSIVLGSEFSLAGGNAYRRRRFTLARSIPVSKIATSVASNSTC